MLFKDLVKEIRMRCLITQSTLSDWSNIDQGSISQYEKGERIPGLLNQKKLIDIANDKAKMNIKQTDIEF